MTMPGSSVISSSSEVDELHLGDDEWLTFGSSDDATLGYNTTDGNAHHMVVSMPTVAGNDVPVVSFGISIHEADLGVFNGLTQPLVAVMDADDDSYVGHSYSGDDVAVLRMAMSGGTVREHVYPNVASDTFTLNAATQTLTNKTFGDALTLDGDLTVTGAVTVGVDVAGHDVKFFGNTAGEYMLWDTSADSLVVIGEVAIGTATPNAYDGYGVLTLNGSTGGVVDLEVNGTRQGTLFAISTYVKLSNLVTGAMHFATDNTNRLTIEADGDINLENNDLLNVGAAGSDRDTTSLRNAGDYFGANGKGMVIGHTAKIATGGVTAEFQVVGNSVAEGSMTLYTASTTDASD